MQTYIYIYVYAQTDTYTPLRNMLHEPLTRSLEAYVLSYQKNSLIGVARLLMVSL